MKTQILLRSIFIALALLISSNNKGSNMQPIKHNVSYYAQGTKSVKPDAKQENKKAPYDNANDAGTLLYISHPNDDHDCECFDFKHHQKRGFWRTVANKLFAIFYDLILLSPVAVEILRELLHHSS